MEQTSLSIKSLISGITGVLESAKLLSKAKKTLADALENCQFDCLGKFCNSMNIQTIQSLSQVLSSSSIETKGINQGSEKGEELCLFPYLVGWLQKFVGWL